MFKLPTQLKLSEKNHRNDSLLSFKNIKQKEYNARQLSVPQGMEFQINTYPTDSQSFPIIAAFNDGSFVVVWATNGQDSSGYGIFGQCYTKIGNKKGEIFQVNTYFAGNQWQPAVATLNEGGFVVTWSSDGQDGSRRYAKADDYVGNI